MVEFTVENLVDIYKRELSSPEILELPEDFYAELAELISRLNEGRKGDALQRELLEEKLKNVEFLVEEIHDARVAKALDRIAAGEPPTSLLERERTSFLEIRQSLEKLRSEMVGAAVSGKTAMHTPSERTRVPVIMKVNFGERILGSDQLYYGPFKSGEVVNLPKANADFMLRHDYARSISLMA